MADAARSQFLLVLATVAGVLLFATVVSRVLQARDGGERTLALRNLEARIRSWWVMVAVLAGAVLAGPHAVVALFALVSLAALRELLAVQDDAHADPVLDAGCCALVLGQYALLAFAPVALATYMLPLAAMLLLPLLAVATRGPHALQARVAQRLWSVLLAGWCLSHVAALVRLDAPGAEGRGLLLVVYVVIVTQSSDVLQYVFGKLYGRRPIAPVVSPDKTVEGYLGGTLAASAVGAALWWMTPFAPWQAALAALALTQLGFAGGLVLSAVKRDLGRKDWGAAIHGHGGVLDRVDSLWLSAPVLFHAVRLVAP